MRIKWSHKSINALGIRITHDKKALMSTSFNLIINKIENSIRIWPMSDLIVYGKVAVVKAHLQL